jgi:flagellar basal body rod protein FlgB
VGFLTSHNPKGLHGLLRGCELKERKKQQKNKTKNTKWKRTKYSHVQENSTKPAKQISFKNIKVKTSYTHEDGHVGRNM